MEQIDYKMMWDRLYGEVDFLITKGVETINPIILQSYMDFIEDIGDLTKAIAELNKEVLSQQKGEEG